MNQESTANDIKLSDVMLTMDVADTLRHNRSVVDRELNTDKRDQELTRKVRDIYASQGIEVSDEVIEEAVKSLRDQRFAYTPAPETLTTRLWNLYVQRGKWKKKLWASVAALLAAWGIYYGTMTVPQSREVAYQVQTINEGIKQASLEIDVIAQQQERIRNRLTQAQQEFPVTLRQTANDIRKDVAANLEQSNDLLVSARELSQDADLTPGNLVAKEKTVSGRLEHQKSLLVQAQTQLNSAVASLDLLDNLDEVPQTLNGLLEQVKSVAIESAVIQQAETYHTDGLAALRSRQGEGITQSVSNLKSLLARLETEYSLRVVSSPGEQSGVWRIPDNNPGARNYYLIVEAISPTGERLTLPIESEEDGKRENISKWGVRVSQADFQAVSADKQDNGIIENNIIGVKKRGRLKPDYQVDNLGGHITQW
jgi:hypothetical protein